MSTETQEETIVDETVSESTALQEETSENLTKDNAEVKKDTKEEVEEAVLEGIELTDNDERGKYSFQIGDSIYFGNTKKEVLSNVLKGKIEQDSYIKKLKVSEKIKVPEKHADDVEPVVEMPNEREIYSKHLESLAKQQSIDVKMFGWSRDQWNQYQEDNGLRDWEIGRIVERVERTVQRANELTDKDVATANVAYINNQVLEEETNSVREMLAESGIPESEWGKSFDYDAILSVATKKTGKNGVILSGAITAEAGKQIAKILRQSTPVKKDIAKEIDRGKELKEKIKTPIATSKKTNDDNEELPISLDELTRKLKEKIRGGK